MHHNSLGIISAVLAFLGFLTTYQGVRNALMGTKVLIAIASGILAIPGATFAVYYTHVIPEVGWYYQFRSLPGTELLVIFVGIAAGALAAILPRVLSILPLFGVAAFSMLPLAKTFLGPIPDGSFRDKWKDGICLQSTASTCGAASLATILRSLGADAKEADLAEEAHSYVGGTEAWYLARAARYRGFAARFHLRPGFDPEAEFPAVVGVRMGAAGHFIAILNRTGDDFLVGDPLVGREVLTRRELLGRYDFTGFHLTIARRSPSQAR